MIIDSAFPSKYLRAADIGEGQSVSVVMSDVKIESITESGNPEDDKPVLYFEGKQKGLVLNKTNAATIAVAFGNETNGWTRRSIEFFGSTTPFSGRIVPCIRVRAQAQAATEPISVPVAPHKPLDDSQIPF